MKQDLDLIVVATPATSFEAKVVVAVLESAGIPTYGPTGLLMDEFAISQALMNVGTQVRVRATDRARAERALAAARQAGEDLEQEGLDPAD